MTYFLPSSALWQFATLLGPGKRAPPSPPKKNFFLSFPKGNLTLGGVRFLGRTQVENWHCAGFSPHFFLTIKLPSWDIDGATRGVEPSMSQKGSLMLRKKYGEKPAQKIAKNMSFLGT